MHEVRRGEMANLREVPFGRYYGGVDTTPLFVMLAGRTRSAPETVRWSMRSVPTFWRRRAGSKLDSTAVQPDFWIMPGEDSGLANQA
jgi:hypothetical protein